LRGFLDAIDGGVLLGTSKKKGGKKEIGGMSTYKFMLYLKCIQ